MASKTTDIASGRVPAGVADLLLQETIHRGSNDLQMIVGLLALQSRRVQSPEARQALTDVMERVAVLARARRDLGRDRQPSLSAALRHVCTALQSQAEPRSILIALNVEGETTALSAMQVTTLALVVNELATNAIKHGYEEGKSGHILVTQSIDAAGGVTVLVDDDGLPFPDPRDPARDGLGLEIARRLMASVDGLFIPPMPGSKIFELRVPVGTGR